MGFIYMGIAMKTFIYHLFSYVSVLAGYESCKATPLIKRSFRGFLAVILVASTSTVFANVAPSATGIQITTAKAISANWAVSIPAQGEVLPWEVAVISAKAEGIAAMDVAVVEGDLVKKGQVLARFDDRLLRAGLAQAQAEFALATANHQHALANLTRFDQLKTKHMVSEQEYELVANQAAIAAATWDQAAAQVESAKIRLADALVTATDDGKILERNLELGQVPQNGQVLFRVLRQQKLEWVAKIDAAELMQVKPGMAAEVRLGHLSDLAGQRTVTGKVRSLSPQLDASSRLATIRVLLDDAPDVAVNTYAEGKILMDTNTAIVVPAHCLVIKDGKTWLFRINNQSVEQVLVTVGRRQGDKVEITSGIKDGDLLVQEGAGFLNHGDSVAITHSIPFAGI
jgi:RND family efflux transporter MFP subunit